MDKTKIALGVALVAVVIAIGGYFFPVVSSTLSKVGTDVANTRFPHGLDVTEDGCYAVDGTCVIDSSGNFDGTITSGTTNVGTFTKGGGTLATSTSGTATTIKLSDFGYGLIEVTPNTADLTYTFPASSTLSTLIPNSGDSRSWFIYNATTTEGIDLVLAAGTGSTFLNATSTLTIPAGDGARLEAVRKSNTDILWYLDIFN